MPSMKIHPYLNFNGNAEEAMRFYERAVGGELTEVHRFGEMPAGVRNWLKMSSRSGATG